MSKPLSPDKITSFRAVMQHGSLSAAARALHMSQPTVRRHIETLERDINARLFTRASNGLTPTNMAHELMPIAQSVYTETEAFARTASSAVGALNGTVRVTCSRVLAAHDVPQALATLRSTAPDVTLELTSTDATENLLRRAADIAIRMAPPVQDALIAKRLPDIALGLFATPELANTVFDLAEAPFISDDRDRQIEAALSAHGLPALQNVVFRSDDALAQIAALQAGVGVGVCQCSWGERLGLVRLSPEITAKLPCFVVMHEDQSQIERVRHVFDLLVQRLNQGG